MDMIEVANNLTRHVLENIQPDHRSQKGFGTFGFKNRDELVEFVLDTFDKCYDKVKEKHTGKTAKS